MNSTSFKLSPAVTLVSLGSLLILMAGCRVGPKYVRPPVTAPEAYRGADEASVSSADQESLGDEKWAQVFHEPELQDLIRKALENNYDVRIAAQRVLEAQAQLRIIRS
jgi:outer membrane protein, multidrug efflux system